MFTGIVREVGRVRSIRDTGDLRLSISCARPVDMIEIGASVSCSGICLTVIETGRSDGGTWFDVEASTETASLTTLADWKTGTAVNLEPALRLGDELGGHIVAGHVDGVGTITEVRPEGASHRVTVTLPRDLARFVAPKGSITLDGISLTVNEVGPDGFGVNIIPHTWAVTNLADAAAGRRVNLEIDLLARYVARLAETG